MFDLPQVVQTAQKHFAQDDDPVVFRAGERRRYHRVSSLVEGPGATGGCLESCDGTSMLGQPGHDRLFKVQPIIDLIVPVFHLSVVHVRRVKGQMCPEDMGP